MQKMVRKSKERYGKVWKGNQSKVEGEGGQRKRIMNLQEEKEKMRLQEEMEKKEQFEEKKQREEKK